MTEIQKWRAVGNCVYNGDDLGSLVAECSSRAVAEALVQYANGSFELRKRIAAPGVIMRWDKITGGKQNA